MGLFSSLGSWAPAIGQGLGSALGGPIGGAVGQGLGQNIADEKRRQEEQAAWNQNANLQREFAQMGVRWRVQDAEAAGIHPLAALGAPLASAAPMAIGTGSGADFPAMGADIARAVMSQQTASEKQMAELQIQSAQLDLQGKALDNQIKNSQLRKLNAPGTGPGLPGSQNFISGQGNSGARIQEKPLERTSSLAGHPESEPGAIPDLGWAKTSTGVVPIPSGDVKQRIEDVMPHEWSHYYRNNIAPNFGGGTKPPKSALPKGATEWKWNFSAQEYQPKFRPNDPAQKRTFKYERKNTEVF